MINRRALVISSFISSIIAFIFQCLPKAITIAERIDGDRYIIRYSSYFNNPLKGWPILTLIVVVCTLVVAVLSAILIRRNKKSLIITSLVFCGIAFASNVFLLCLMNNDLTASGVIITVLLLCQAVIDIILLRMGSRYVNFKCAIINYLSLIITAIALILQCIPSSVKTVDGGVAYFESYFQQPADAVTTLTFCIGMLTTFALLINIFALIKDKKPVGIAKLVCLSLAVVLSIVLSIVLGKCNTAYNIVVLILLAALTAMQCARAKLKDWQ